MLSALAAAVVVTAAGCGGDETLSAEEEWAGGVCSTIATWHTDISTVTQDAVDALKTPATARQDLESAFDEGLAATQELVDDLEALDPPDTPEGAEAKEQLDAFLATVQTMSEDGKTALADLPDASSLSEALTTLSGLGTQLQTAVTQAQDLLTTLKGIGGDLKTAFESADACQDLADQS